MRIHLNNGKGEWCFLSTASDSFVLFALVAAQFTVFPFSWLLVLIAMLALHIALVIYWYFKRSFGRVIPLSYHESSCMKDVRVLSERLGLKQAPKVFVDTRKLSASARVIPHGVGGALLLSVGFLLRNEKKTPGTKEIIAHELAHIANGDWKVLRLGALIYFAFFSNILLTIISGGDAEQWFFALVAPAVAMTIYHSLLRRRELFADALAINALESRDDYLNLLSKGGMIDYLTHPSSKKRLDSITQKCVAAKFSWFLLFIILVVTAATLQKSFAWISEFSSSPGYIAWLCALHLLPFLLLEILKPWGNWIPSTYPEASKMGN